MKRSENHKLRVLIESLEDIKKDVNVATYKLLTVIADNKALRPEDEMYLKLDDYYISLSNINSSLFEARLGLADNIHKLENSLKVGGR